MLELKVEKLTVKSLGITLTKDSTQEQLGNALKHKPNLNKFIVETKTAKNDKTEKTS